MYPCSIPHVYCMWSTQYLICSIKIGRIGLYLLLLLLLQKAKLEAKLHQTTAAAAAAASAASAVSAVGPVHNSVPSNPVAAPGFFIHPSDVIPPTPKTTPLFMTPPLTPPNEAVSVVINAELAQLFPGSVIDPPTVNLAAHNKNSNKSRMVNYYILNRCSLRHLKIFWCIL